MFFFVKSAHDGRFLGQYSREAIRTQVLTGHISRFDWAAETRGLAFAEYARAENQHWLTVQDVLEAAPEEPVDTDSPLLRYDHDRCAIVEKLRARSCYTTLRWIIDVATALALLAAVLSGLAAMGVALKAQKLWVLLWLLLSTGLSCMLIVGAKHLVHLFVDMGDVLLEQHRRAERKQN